VIELERASVWLGGCQILKRIDWRLERGEHWLITGANGSGKSTLLKLLHGQLRPATGGRIRWPLLGNPRNVWQLRRKIGYVSAEYQADYRYPTTVADCIGSGIESSVGLTRKLTLNESERVDGLLLYFGLEQLRDRLLTTISYGQMHRVLIARMLVNRPAVLLLDEPWEGLDGDSIDLVTEQLEKAMAAGTQLVCASHTGAAQLPFTAGLVLSAGRISDDDASA
jgi:ABC-type molybdenum transport system ATPase subunit/photorepair protein PhrA